MNHLICSWDQWDMTCWISSCFQVVLQAGSWLAASFSLRYLNLIMSFAEDVLSIKVVDWFLVLNFQLELGHLKSGLKRYDWNIISVSSCQLDNLDLASCLDVALSSITLPWPRGFTPPMSTHNPLVRPKEYMRLLISSRSCSRHITLRMVLSILSNLKWNKNKQRKLTHRKESGYVSLNNCLSSLTRV